MTKINSSNIDAIGYDPAERRLRVKFKNGNLYDYAEVPPIEYERFSASASKGAYFHTSIRSKYPSQRVTE